MTVDDYLMISALQHYLFCPRQAALIHLEQQWRDNPFTVEGQAIHKQVDRVGLALRKGTRLARAVPLVSHHLKLSGRADLIAIEPDGALVPVEYKRGRKGRWSANEVQLCAQAMALEEMMSVTIQSGIIFYHASRKRHSVCFTPELRETTRQAAEGLHQMISRGTTPAGKLDRRCDACSLRPLCLPELWRDVKGTREGGNS